ncbi:MULTISPECIES: XRE family transcriptional regulator [Sphingobium]|uniref:XRE family transcriptional regulator n=1 Tax=Sphingobium TaxID=165695 RepID=UPI0018D51718|nr:MULTISPECIES: XRE family transcriptional regulator [Sphingobium]
MSGRQCSAARSLLGWSSAQLAEAAKVGQATVKRFEAGDSVRDTSVGAIRAALEEAGLMFIAAGESATTGGEGVRRRT